MCCSNGGRVVTDTSNASTRGLHLVWRKSRSAGTVNWPISIALICVASLLYLAVSEVALRLATGVSVTQMIDFRKPEDLGQEANASLEFDPVLGWGHRAHVVSNWFNTLDNGFRTNGDPNTVVKKGGVIAVGSSFTAGSEVNDHESWPAQLEDRLGRDVYNAGVGGYSADQIILNAERLMETLEPEVIVIDLLADNILGNGYSTYGRAKPYFTVEDGKLVHHNDPVPPWESEQQQSSGVKELLSYSLLADRFLSAHFPDFWKAANGSGYTKTGADEVLITCHLLERVKQQADRRGTRLLLYLHFAGSHISNAAQQPAHTRSVQECAESIALQVVNEFDVLRDTYTTNRAEFLGNYVIQKDGSTGHKSIVGNGLVAQRVAGALAGPEPEAVQVGVRQQNDDIAFGSNRLQQPETLHQRVASTPHARFSSNFSWWIGERQYTVTARGPIGEHYVVIGGFDLEAGQYQAVMDAKSAGTTRLVVQFRAGGAGAAIAQVDLETARCSVTPIAKMTNASCRVEALEGTQWHRVFVAATYTGAPSPGDIIVQLADANGSTSFLPRSEAIEVRALGVQKQIPAQKDPAG